MRVNQIFSEKLLWVCLLVFIAFVSWSSKTDAGELQVSWSDNSTDEAGFKIERKSGTTGTYAQITTVAANVTSYTDSTLTDGATYCYQVRAYNSAGNSAYTAERCGVARSTGQTFNLATSKIGTGTGTVTSSPAGINCGSDCSEAYASATIVALTATAASGSIFAGWTGNADCTDGSVVMNANKTCTATFNPVPQNYTVNVAIVNGVTSSGTGSGTVTSSPAGINCGSDCSESYVSGTLLSLTATPASGSTFAGWSGDADCFDGSLTVNANKTCNATFNPVTTTFTLSVAMSGSGKVTSAPAGIDCGSDCSESYTSGTIVALSATPEVNSTFAGWSGTGCATGTVVMNANINCTANFQTSTIPLATRLGVFRAATGEWFLDHDGNGQWDQNVDIYITGVGQTGDLPVIGSWSGNGTSNIGLFAPSTGTWQLDTNGDRVLNCAVDSCFGPFGEPQDIPVARQIAGLTGSIVGTYTPPTVVKVNGRNRIQRGAWRFDANANNAFDGCSVDDCGVWKAIGERPVVGDWNGDGTDDLGLFVSKYGKWYLDGNGNEAWNGCWRDKCVGTFGIENDLPVAGDWDGTGKVRIGVFRPSTGMWYLDSNGNGRLDACGVDACLGPFGAAGDLPVVGRW